MKRRVRGCVVGPGTLKFLDVVNACGVQGQSDDEDDNYQGVPTALTDKLPWRSTELRTILRLLDYAYIGTKLSHDGRLIIRKVPRCRTAGPSTSSMPAVKGLPQNCYDPEWLAGLHEKALRDLGVRKPVDLSVSLELQRFVFNTAR